MSAEATGLGVMGSYCPQDWMIPILDWPTQAHMPHTLFPILEVQVSVTAVAPSRLHWSRRPQHPETFLLRVDAEPARSYINRVLIAAATGGTEGAV